MRTLRILATALFVGACSTPVQQTPAPQPVPQPVAAPAAPVRSGLDPLGVYDFSTDIQGSQVKGVITISRNAQGAFTGTITTDMTEPMPVTRVTVDGQKLEVRSATADGELVINAEFTADKFTGKWDLAGTMNGVMTGTKRKS